MGGQSQHDVLVAIQRAHFELAAKLDVRQFRIQVATSALAVVALLLPAGRWDFIAAILPLVLAGVCFWAQVRSRNHRLLAEKARRATLLANGLGVELSPNEMGRFYTLSGLAPEELAKWSDPHYFATVAAPGVARAAAMLEESAFWTMNLTRASAERVRNRLLIFGTSLVVCFLISLGWAGHTALPAELRIFCALASSLVWLELLQRWLLYGDAIDGIDEVLTRLDWLRRSSYGNEGDFLLALVDYNSAVETAPLLVDGLYAKHKERIEAAWKERCGAA
jgi:hypothetical protein